MDATTTRASTGIRSMPTSETRTHASMTMPLSSTRSSTSIRLVPPAARSTAILQLLGPLSSSPCRTRRRCSRPRRGRSQRLDLPFQLANLRLQLLVLSCHPALSTWGQIAVVPPPVEADFLRFVERADEQPNPYGQQLDFRQRSLDISRDHQPFVEHSIEDIDQAGGAMGRELQSHSKRL